MLIRVPARGVGTIQSYGSQHRCMGYLQYPRGRRSVRVQHGLVYIKHSRCLFPRKKRTKSNGVTSACWYFSHATRFWRSSNRFAGLQLYSLMREVACTADPSLSVYCYVEAASSSNPSDMYFYSLPFGTPLPNNTTPSCSTCTRSIMNLFANATGSVDGLKQTYDGAAALTSSHCGSSYLSNASTSSAMSWIGDTAVPRRTVLVMLCVTLVGLL